MLTALQGQLEAIPHVRSNTMDGTLLTQRARFSRERIWDAIHHRYLAPRIEWILQDLSRAAPLGPTAPELVSLLYIHYVLRDRLSWVVVTDVIWEMWKEGKRLVSLVDILAILDTAPEEDRRRAASWTAASRRKLAGSILTALRDFGLLKGSQRKQIVPPMLPLSTALHIVRLLVWEGLQGAEIISDKIWRIFLRTPEDVADLLLRLSQAGHLKFERAGQTVMLDAPLEWKEAR